MFYLILASICLALLAGTAAVSLALLIETVFDWQIEKRAAKRLRRDIRKLVLTHSQDCPYSFETLCSDSSPSNDALLTDMFALLDQLAQFDLARLKLAQRQIDRMITIRVAKTFH
jgi:hypothetical protein